MGPVYNDYGKPLGISFSIHVEEPSDGKLILAICAGDKDCLTTPILLNFKGWRNMAFLFDRGDFKGAPTAGMDRIEFRGTTDKESSGKPRQEYLVHLDQIVPCAEVDPRNREVVPSETPLMKPNPVRRCRGAWDYYDSAEKCPLEPLRAPTPAEAEGMKTIENRMREGLGGFSGKGPAASATESVLGRVAQYHIDYGPGGVRRLPASLKEPVPLSPLVQSVGGAWLHAQTPAERAALLDAALRLFDYMADQDIGLAWYPGRGTAEGFWLMRDGLAQSGRLPEVMRWLRSKYSFNRVYDRDRNFGVEGMKGEDTDTLYTCYPAMLCCAMLEPDEQKRLRDLIALTRWYDEVALAYGPSLVSTLKPDGTLSHHAGFSQHYGTYTLSGIIRYLHYLVGTPFMISRETLGRVRHALKTEYFMYAGPFIPGAFSGIAWAPQWTHSLPTACASLAWLGEPDGTFDREFAGMYLAITDAKSPDAKKFLAGGAKPLPPSDGHLTLPWVVGAVHHAANRQVNIRGYSRYCHAFENWPCSPSWARYALYTHFTSYGFTEILEPFSPRQTETANGLPDLGLDWTRMPGTTVVRLPLEGIRALVLNNENEPSEHLYSDEKFVGGTQFDDGTAVFTQRLHGDRKYGLDSLYAFKSWYFAGDEVFCLGSGIKSDVANYPVETTLFQTFMGTNAAVLGGVTRSSLSYGAPDGSADSTVSMPGLMAIPQVGAKGMWMVDPRGMGWWVGGGQKVYAAFQNQTSPDSWGRGIQKGDWAVCGIDHGICPQNASYRYAFILRADEARMKQFSKAMAGANAPWQVVRADDRAHIVHHLPTDTWFYSLYAMDYHLNQGPLKVATSACSVMIRPSSSGGYSLAIADPDLRLYEGPVDDLNIDNTRRETSSYSKFWFWNESKPSVVRLVLNGDLKVESAKSGHSATPAGPAVTTASGDGGTTMIAVTCQNGLTTTVQIAQKL